MGWFSVCCLFIYVYSCFYFLFCECIFCPAWVRVVGAVDRGFAVDACMCPARLFMWDILIFCGLFRGFFIVQSSVGVPLCFSIRKSFSYYESAFSM